VYTKYCLNDFDQSVEYRQLSERAEELPRAWAKVATALFSASFEDFDAGQRPEVERQLSAIFAGDIDYLFEEHWGRAALGSLPPV
jgi:hypothetical protein